MSDYHANGTGDPAQRISSPFQNPFMDSSDAPFDQMALLISLARDAGMLITLDGQIGREKYQSVAGSLASLRCFAIKLKDLLLTRATV